MIEIKSIPIGKKDKLESLLRQIINDNKESLKEEIKGLNLDLPLESYFTIDFDDIYLKRASVSSSLPKWLKDYLITCFVTAQQQILEDVHK